LFSIGALLAMMVFLFLHRNTAVEIIVRLIGVKFSGSGVVFKTVFYY